MKLQIVENDMNKSDVQGSVYNSLNSPLLLTKPIDQLGTGHHWYLNSGVLMTDTGINQDSEHKSWLPLVQTSES